MVQVAEKVILPRKVADAIEVIRVAQEEGASWEAGIKIDLLDRKFLDRADADWEAVHTINEFLKESIENAAKYFWAVKCDYDIEPTPEEKVQALLNNPPYSELHMKDSFRCGVYRTLEAFGITLKGMDEA